MLDISVEKAAQIETFCAKHEITFDYYLHEFHNVDYTNQQEVQEEK